MVLVEWNYTGKIDSVCVSGSDDAGVSINL